MRSGRGRTLLVGLVAVVAVALGGCSSSNKSTASGSSTTVAHNYPAGKEQVCKARDQLKTSVEDLTNPTLLTSGSSAIKSAVSNVQDNLKNLEKAAKEDYKPQVQDVQNAVKDLQSSVENRGNNSITSNLQNIGNAISKVGSTSSALLSKLNTDCGS
jgi:gas vesicle protein